MAPQSTRTYRASPSSYVFFGIGAFGFTGLIILPIFISYIPPSAKTLVFATIAALTLPTLTFWWLSRFKLKIGPDRVSYSSAFTREQSVSLTDVSGGELVLLYERKRISLGVKTPTGIKLRVHHKVFSDEAYRDLRNALLLPAFAEPPAVN